MLDKASDPTARDVLRVRDPEDGRRGGEAQPHDQKSQAAGAGDDDHRDPGGQDDESKPSLWRRHPIAIIVAVLVLIVAVIAGILYYLHARHFESTDDAFVDSRPVSVSAEITGNITEVLVTDNQVVQPGDLLVRIDVRNYTAAVDQAQAQIDQAKAQFADDDAMVQAQKSQVGQAERQVAEAQAALEFSQNENQRYQDLVKTGAGTVQRAQQAASDLLEKQAGLAAAQASQSAAEKQITALKAQRRIAEAMIDGARAQKETADANLTRAEIHATVEGRVTRLTAATGFTATSGEVLMIIVPLDVWVTANFKETQLGDMRVGQAVDIKVDAYGMTYPGKVDSIQAGSGTAFSLLPAQNATGNYVKVVQRIPVKITFDQRPDVELGPGMSVVPTARVR